LERAIELDLVSVLREALRNGLAPDARIGERPLLSLARLNQAKACEQALTEGKAIDAGAVPTWAAAEALDEPLAPLKITPVVDHREAENRHVAATVQLELEIDDRGRVFASRVIGQPDVRLAIGALRMARTWTFHPPKRKGAAVRTTVAYALQFPAAPEAVIDDALVDVPPQPITRWIAHVLPWGENSGEVVAQCIVRKDGLVHDVQILKAPDGEHAREAFRAVPHWSFTPGVRDGVLVDARTKFTVPVDF
jgi:TonB family protein